MKTRQQRLAEERAGHPSSPPQQLAVKNRGPRRTRTKQPIAGNASVSSPAPVPGSGQVPGRVLNQLGSVEAGPVAPTTQLAVPGEAQALLRLWAEVSPEAVASGRPVGGPTLELAIPSADVPDLLAFIKSRLQAEPQLQKRTPSRMAPQTAPADIEPSLQKTSPFIQSPSTNERVYAMDPHTTPAGIESAIRSPNSKNPIHTMSYMAPHTTPTRIEPPLQKTSSLVQSTSTNERVYAMDPHTTPAGIESASPIRSPDSKNPIHTMSYMAPHTTPTRIEPALQKTLHPVQSPSTNERVYAVDPHTTPAGIESASPIRSPDSKNPIRTMSYMAPHTTPTRIEPALQKTPPPVQSPSTNERVYAVDSHTTPAGIESASPIRSPNSNNLIHTMSHMAPQTAPTGIEPALQNSSLPAQSPKINQPIYTMSQMTPRIEPAPVRSPNVNKVINKMSQSVLSQTANKRFIQQPVPSSRETPTTAYFPKFLYDRSQTLAYTADGAALYGRTLTTANASGSNETLDDHEVSQQLDDEASTGGDSDMEDVSESSSPARNLVESSIQEATQSTQERSPETPRRSGWGLGNLIQSAHYSMKRRFGFSPLTPVSERSESTPQTQTETPAQMQIETPVRMQTETMTPRKPKKKNSVPTSVRATRARNRRQNDSVATGNSITIGPNQRDQKSRAKKASTASRSTEATVTEEENSLAKSPIHRNQEEARKTQTLEPEMKPTIRFPSRSLDRTLANKRKRWGSPDTIPNPEGKSCGLGGAESYGSPEEDGVTEQQPGKLRRTSKSHDFSSQAAGNAKTPIPITNSAGTFKVPSPGDGDWSSSESEEEEMHTTSEPSKPQQSMRPAAVSEALRRARDKALKHRPRKPSSLGRSSMTCSSPPESAAAEPSTVGNPEPTGRPKYNAYEEWCKTAPAAVTAAVDKLEVDTTLAGNAFEEALDNSGPAGRENFNAYEEWCRTASPAVIAVLGKMAVDANLAGSAFEGGLGDFATSVA